MDDVGICLEGINRLLRKRNLASLSLSRYRQIFTFPVMNYYMAAGFNFDREPFEIPAEEFIIQYAQLLPKASLFGDVESILSHFNAKGFRQFILSAMEQATLRKSVHDKGIAHFFEQICGIDDHFAHSKLERAKKMMEAAAITRGEAVMIGDTLHDVEVAAGIGVEIILIARGHQSPERLTGAGTKLLPDLLALNGKVC